MSDTAQPSGIGRRGFLAKGAAVGLGATALGGLNAHGSQAVSPTWDYTVDIVVVGAGASGLPAAVRARDRGASVLIVEENTEIGGHGMISGGVVTLGGGTPIQKKFGISDSADQVYLENTRPDHPMTRYNDRAVVRAFADHNIEVFEFLVSKGVKFLDVKPALLGAEGVVTPRRHAVQRWSDDINETINGSGGSGVMRTLEKSARASGVEIRVQHRMTRIIRESPTTGPVLGIEVLDLITNKRTNIRATRGVISCTGGSSSNLVIRTIYDPRLTEEYQVGCEPYSRQSGDTEQQGMAIGASLGSTSNQRCDSFVGIQKTAFIGCRYGYARWNPASPFFAKAGASGLAVVDYQDAILVNMLGNRFYDETVAQNLSPADGAFAAYDYFAAAFSSAIVEVNGTKRRAGGPIWAIFDSDAVQREKWDPRPPFVDVANGYFFTADTITQMTRQLTRNPYQKTPMPPGALEETIAKYNSYVDLGKDPEFNKPRPKYKIQTPPFYAAWATPILHDTYTGLRVTPQYQVVDVFGKVIPGFYAAGEAAGGMTLHGLARCIVGGYIAGTNAVPARS